MSKAKQVEDLGILKLLFQKKKSGAYAIKAIMPLPLKAKDEGSRGFFTIKNDVAVAQPNIAGTTNFFLGQSIVPIVIQAPGENVLRCLGTGFFVSCTGLLITAAHVVTDPIERRYGGVTQLPDQRFHFGELRWGVMLPLNPLIQGNGFIYREIEWATFLAEESESPLPIRGVDLRLKSDIAICKVRVLPNDGPHQPLTIIQPGLRGLGIAAGKSATAIGYGAMRDIELRKEREQVVSGDFPFDLHASTGSVIEHFPDNVTEKQVSTPGPCFSASLTLPAGMSGSPIFDHEGVYVHGVVSKGLVDANGLAPFGYGSMLAPSLSIPVKLLGGKTLLDLYKTEEHGFPKLRGPGDL